MSTPGNTSTGWTQETTFSTADPAVLAELAKARQGKNSQYIGHLKADRAYGGHACGGEIYTDLYFDDTDGHLHAGVSIWYPCESYLEILGDVVVA
jgi:hypothetical protein